MDIFADEQQLNTLKKLNSYVFESEKNNDTYLDRGYFVEDPNDKHRPVRLDLAVLTRKDNKLVKAYEVYSYTAYERNLNTIHDQLEYYQEITKVPVYMAYLDDGESIQRLSLQDVKKEILKRKLEPIDKKIVNSFADYSKIIKEINEAPNWDVRFFYRGDAFYRYPPVPSIYRDNAYKEEVVFYKDAMRLLPKEFTKEMNTFDNLVKMQHYGLPTRLLDITSNPLVALYFACEKAEDKDKDGKVLVYSFPKNEIRYYNSRSTLVLANLAKVSDKFDFDKDKGYLAFIINEDIPNYDKKYLNDKIINQAFCVYPRLNNDRIIRQEGAFIIYGMDKKKEKQAELRDGPIVEIIINKDAKEEILKGLEILGINESSLFPETDKVMKHIKQEVFRSIKLREASFGI